MAITFIEKARQDGEKLRKSEDALHNDLYKLLDASNDNRILQARDYYLIRKDKLYGGHASFKLFVEVGLGGKEREAVALADLWETLAVKTPVTPWEDVREIRFNRLLIISKAGDFKQRTSYWVDLAHSNTAAELDALINSGGTTNAPKSKAPVIRVPCNKGQFVTIHKGISIAKRPKDNIAMTWCTMVKFIESNPILFEKFKHGKGGQELNNPL